MVEFLLGGINRLPPLHSCLFTKHPLAHGAPAQGIYDSWFRTLLSKLTKGRRVKPRLNHLRPAISPDDVPESQTLSDLPHVLPSRPLRGRELAAQPGARVPPPILRVFAVLPLKAGDKIPSSVEPVPHVHKTERTPSL